MTESFFYFPPENPRSWDWQGAGPIQQHCSVGHSTDNFKIEVSCFEGTVKIKLSTATEDSTQPHMKVQNWEASISWKDWISGPQGVLLQGSSVSIMRNSLERHIIRSHLRPTLLVCSDKPRQRKSRDITLLTEVFILKAMVFLVVIYGCKSWTIKKAEHRRIDA